MNMYKTSDTQPLPVVASPGVPQRRYYSDVPTYAVPAYELPQQRRSPLLNVMTFLRVVVSALLLIFNVVYMVLFFQMTLAAMGMNFLSDAKGGRTEDVIPLLTAFTCALCATGVASCIAMAFTRHRNLLPVLGAVAPFLWLAYGFPR